MDAHAQGRRNDMRLMYFRGPNPDAGDEYIILSEETKEFIPTKDFARSGFHCLYELDFDPIEGEGRSSALPVDEELWISRHCPLTRSYG